MSAAPKKKPIAKKEHKLMIVDDSFLMRKVIRNIIDQDPSFNIVGEAADGVEALETVAENKPDVILLDIEMPNMDGIEFMKRARLLTDATIIVISSVTRLGSPQSMEALDLGVSDIIPKPSGVLSVDLEEKRSKEVLEAIHRCLGE